METYLNEAIAAVRTLYNPQLQDKAKFNQANQWLGQLQQSVQAWKVADQLLHMKLDLNTCFFAAQTIRTKIQLYFGELPLESHESLKNSMLEHISCINEGTYQGIAMQLCIALADLALHMSSWQDPIGDMITQFGPSSSTPNLAPLMQVLTALPEELHCHQLKLGLNRRKQLEDYFESKVPSIIELLHTVVSTEGVNKESTHLKCLQCLASWFNIHTSKWVLLNSTCLINDVLTVIRNPQSSPGLHDIATECICSAMIMLEADHITPLAEVLFVGILGMGDSYQMAVALEDLDAVSNYASIFSVLGETFLELMVEQPGEGLGSLQVLHLMLSCTEYHDWEVAEITFNFWYKLSEVLYHKNCGIVNNMFKPYVEQLIEMLYRHCQIEPDHKSILMKKDDFYEFRERVQDLIKGVAFVCGSSGCFQQMLKHLQIPETTNKWNSMEAALFIMQSVAINLIPEENEMVPSILEAVLNQPEGIHIQVELTSIMFLSELNEWVACHPDMLPLVLQFLTRKLTNEHLATAAAKALDTVCQSSCDHIEQHFEGLMHIVSSLDSFSISNEAMVWLLKCLATILGRLPPHQIKVNMKHLCAVPIRNLQNLIEENVPIERNLPKDPVVWLQHLLAIFQNINPVVQDGEPHPCQEVVMEVWPMLSAAFVHYSSDPLVIEGCCRCIRFTVRCVKQQSDSLLQPLVEQIVSLYASHGHSCFLYLGSVLVDEYANEAGCVPGLLAMLEAFMQPTMLLLTQPHGFRNHPGIVDDWFRLCARFLQRATVPFLQCGVINTIIECGIQACMLAHKEANEAVLNFFQNLLESGLQKQDHPDNEAQRVLVTNIFNIHGEALVGILLSATIFILPPYMHHGVAKIYYQIMLFDHPKFCQWLEARLKSLSINNSGRVEAVSQSQVAKFHKRVTKAERAKEITRALVEFAHYFT